MNALITEWDITTTDHGEAASPRFVVRCILMGTTKVIYGTGETEAQARQDAYKQMDGMKK
jgi:dsRNA-specific ribonuclease